MLIRAAGQTHVGMKRKQNQDRFMLAPDLGTFVVADGMGGHRGGQVASLISVTTIVDYIRDFVKKNGNFGDPRTTLAKAFELANSEIQSKGKAEADLAGMGTTTTALLFQNENLYIAHVGDSRTYLIHPGRIWQLTRDHSLVQEKLRAGLITRDQIKTDLNRNVITRSVGFEEDVDVDIYELEVHPGDVFVVCSDGLTGMVTDQDLLSIIEKFVFEQGSVERAAEALVRQANIQGGDDNITAVVVQAYDVAG